MKKRLLQVSAVGLILLIVAVVAITLHLTDLGKDSGSLTPGDLSKRIIAALLGSSTSSFGSMATELGKGATDAATSLLGKGAAQSAENVSKGIDELLKKKK
jgi:methyl-accepting chemotaxis protein